MTLLDTNVLSEFMRPPPALQVVAWLDKQPADFEQIVGLDLFNPWMGAA